MYLCVYILCIGIMKFHQIQFWFFWCTTEASAFYMISPWNRPRTKMPYSDIKASQSSQSSNPYFTTTSFKRFPYTLPNSQKRMSSNGIYDVGSNNHEKHTSQMKQMWDTLVPIHVPGESLRTFVFPTSDIERVNMMIRSDGLPVHATIELWHGPHHTPVRMNIYNENGHIRPLAVVLETPGGQNSIAVRNTGQLEFPFTTAMGIETAGTTGSTSTYDNNNNNCFMECKLESNRIPRTIQGGAVIIFPFDAYVSSIQIMITTDSRPLHARIELLQGPNCIKQVLDIYCEDGRRRPFYAVFETPGIENVIRIYNTATSMEFPINISIGPFETMYNNEQLQLYETNQKNDHQLEVIDTKYEAFETNNNILYETSNVTKINNLVYNKTSNERVDEPENVELSEIIDHVLCTERFLINSNTNTTNKNTLLSSNHTQQNPNKSPEIVSQTISSSSLLQITEAFENNSSNDAIETNGRVHKTTGNDGMFHNETNNEELREIIDHVLSKERWEQINHTNTCLSSNHQPKSRMDEPISRIHPSLDHFQQTQPYFATNRKKIQEERKKRTNE